jgi:predicted transcriptional regulator
MGTPKEQTLARLQELPEDVTMERILYELYFHAKVDRGLEQLERGETVSEEEAFGRLERWLKSASR